MRLLELYTSVQGEGPNVGLPTTFVRFAGCNLRCPGWPCDTPYAIFPELWSKEFTKVTPDELISQVIHKYPRHICITGGEPFLQPEDEIGLFLDRVSDFSLTADIFTNGTIPFKADAARRSRVTIIMDWKLSGSGEGETLLEARGQNRLNLRPKDALKFVVTSQDDLQEMLTLLHHWKRHWYNIYVAPAWSVIEPAEVVAFLEEHDLPYVKLNLQTHKYVWPAAKRGV